MPAKDLFHYELYRDEFGQHPQVQKAMNELRNNCWVNFQFGNESDETGWFEAQMARDWFQHKSDYVPNKTAWEKLRKSFSFMKEKSKIYFSRSEETEKIARQSIACYWKRNTGAS